MREREAKGLVSLGKGLGGGGKMLGKFAAHANGLRTLPRKDKRKFNGHSERIVSCQPDGQKLL
jgi:hypothetical protein